MTAPIWLLGCGHMGGALLARWLAEDMGPVAVIDPNPRLLPDGVEASAVPPDGRPDVLVLAVKPQVWRAAAAPLLAQIGPMTLVVSVMAGVTTADLAAAFPGAAIIRAMPNTPSAIGQGVTALFTTAGDLAEGAGEALFSAAGATVWLADEGDFDAVTAVSGSGPAYVFAFIEALAAAGVAAGLAPVLADRLARATVTGAAALAAAEAAVPAAELRTRVTSPGGTTAAGLAVLQPGLAPLVAATVSAAAARSRALG
ncbi:pyrroline-5-carboxylate reductase [Polymorphobacter fuscus]|uniref:Pyrroline-5-carboxylate reductase n=1 Tax=Sandarakinorhabdus fusca TaxID=1439888 RepID=A0A7C9KKA1_9SPHN|nr:pyrroline-5-carboxylate reductase [Polymorphobacter fuscus]KAB7644134.1 pyrroline-5-carboxylate reductase [Polymorphobacter fuscus]MQT18521.1 pyrroline-5-carboxylate reductase [Polymorphobacter fuscus]NJC08356.1 pyrroline-5-carboxylate reductase [Polymorphobacter fuscus]